MERGFAWPVVAVVELVALSRSLVSLAAEEAPPSESGV